MTKEQFEPINVAFGEMNAALDSCMMSPAAGYRVVLAYEKVKASLQPHLKIEEPTPTDEKSASNPT